MAGCHFITEGFLLLPICQLDRRRFSLKGDNPEEEIRVLLEKQVSKASIAKIVGVSSTNLRHFIRTRKLASEASKGRDRQRRP